MLCTWRFLRSHALTPQPETQIAYLNDMMTATRKQLSATADTFVPPLSNELTNLCEACRSIFSQGHSILKPRQVSIPHTQWTFMQSVADDCPLCYIIYVSLFDRVQEKRGLHQESDILRELNLFCEFSVTPRRAHAAALPSHLEDALQQTVRHSDASMICEELKQVDRTLGMTI